ncbi:hypothetical protein NBO_28g0013 [Nosema bombycis CQ1]|uniref:Uncharacterized protein n=1 Tax=Nosema bombycis (strain CQ1 / CVCC 102059) TaxID=578461 RepID=R0M8W5_NOSB1|nr:hypothetical protein NBO_28g0013 [Nosema bombycis CQ1]|eukprot:EOB14374.1 hypothetical protein NBO_28g0013 [Nosema bombycis CQ1]
MESIKLENVNDAIKRENLFKKVAMKVLNDLEFKKVDQNFTGEKLRTRRELDDLEKNFVDKDAEKKRKHEKKLEKKVKEVEEEEESFGEEELTTKERRLKNKKTYHQTKGQRKKKLKSRKKANRRKNH